MSSIMRCPKCGGTESTVRDTRQRSPKRKHPFLRDHSVWRRHICKCGFYFSTTEISVEDEARILEKLKNYEELQSALSTLTGR